MLGLVVSIVVDPAATGNPPVSTGVTVSPCALPTGDSLPVQFRLQLAVGSLDRFTGIEADVLIPGYG